MKLKLVVNDDVAKIAKALLIELNSLKAGQLTTDETLATINQALNDARKLAESIKEAA